jgi:hypothetical protein
VMRLIIVILGRGHFTVLPGGVDRTVLVSNEELS